MPKVSVVIPTYNRRAYLTEAIDSVLAQTYADYEVIVVDDGSTDGTRQLLDERYDDRIRYLWQENQGESVARNRGIALATGEYIALLDSDDVWLPDRLMKQVPILDAEPDTVLVFGQAWLMDADGRRLNDPPLCSDVHESDLTLETLCLENALGSGTCTALIRREPLDRVGGFDPAIQLGEDWDLWLRLRRQGQFAFVNEVLGCMRRHAGSQWHYHRPETVDKRLADHLRLLEKFFSDWPGTAPPSDGSYPHTDGFYPHLRERALARQYAIVASLDYAIGRPASGQQRLGNAIQLDPQHWSVPEPFVELLINNLLGIALLRDRPMPETVAHLEAAFDHWPPELSLSKRWKARILGEVYAGLGFASFRARDLSRTRRCLLRAVWHDPSWLCNRGVWSIGFRALPGPWEAAPREGQEVGRDD